MVLGTLRDPKTIFRSLESKKKAGLADAQGPLACLAVALSPLPWLT